MHVSQREAMQRRTELECFSSAPLCIASHWLTSLGQKTRSTRWSLSVEANDVLHEGGQSLLSSTALLTSWLPNRAGHYIFAAVISIFFLLFLAYSQPSQIGCQPYFHTWRGFSANLECMFEMCHTWLTENTGCKNYAKNGRLRTITQLCRAISPQLRHVTTIGKKLVKQQYLPHVLTIWWTAH